MTPEADDLVKLAREIEALKRPCGMDPESPTAIQNSRYMGIAYKVRAIASRIAAQKAAEVDAPSAERFLSAEDRTDLARLDDQFSDGEGWDLPSERMKRLAQLGVIRHAGGSRYTFTSFGQWCVGAWRPLPLETIAEANERSRREMEARNAAAASPAEPEKRS